MQKSSNKFLALAKAKPGPMGMVADKQKILKVKKSKTITRIIEGWFMKRKREKN